MIPSTGQLAQHVATTFDGEYDDGLEAYVQATVKDGDLLITVQDADDNRRVKFRATFERIN